MCHLPSPAYWPAVCPLPLLAAQHHSTSAATVSKASAWMKTATRACRAKSPTVQFATTLRHVGPACQATGWRTRSQLRVTITRPQPPATPAPRQTPTALAGEWLADWPVCAAWLCAICMPAALKHRCRLALHCTASYLHASGRSPSCRSATTPALCSPSCRSDGDPAVCSECAAGMAPDPGTGLCVPCRQANASTHEYCSETDATRCGGGTDCAAGFYCHNVTGQCTPCPQAGCLSCGDVAAPTPGNCSECLPGYWDASRPINERRARTSPVTESGRQYDAFQDVPTECKPCSDTNCLICDTSWGAACERCADGYFLDSATKLCRAVGGWEVA